MKKPLFGKFCFLALCSFIFHSCSPAYLEPNVYCEDCSPDCIMIMTDQTARKNWFELEGFQRMVIDSGEFYEVYYYPTPGTYEPGTVFCQLPTFKVLKKDCKIVDSED